MTANSTCAYNVNMHPVRCVGARNWRVSQGEHVNLSAFRHLAGEISKSRYAPIMLVNTKAW